MDSVSQIQSIVEKQYRIKIEGLECVCAEWCQEPMHPCKGTNKEGRRCVRMTVNASKCSYQHAGK